MSKSGRRPARNLPVHQYCLRFPYVEQPDKQRAREARIRRENLPYLVFRDGLWHLYRNKWKSQFFKHPCIAKCITGATIEEVMKRLQRSHDRYQYQFKEPTV